MIETRIVQKFGNSGHVVLPKEYIGKRIRFITKTKTFSQIKSEIVNIIAPYLEHVLGVYLYGSYARNEETLESDLDILIITDEKIKINNEEYKIVSITEAQIINTLKEDAILVLPIIKEAKPIINPQLIKKYENYKFTKENTKEFLEACQRIININKQSLELDIGNGAIIYSLILRIRGLLILNLSLENKFYTKSALFNFLEKELSKEKVAELYLIYARVRDKEGYVDDKRILKKDIEKLISMAEKLLNNVRKHKWAKRNIKRE